MRHFVRVLAASGYIACIVTANVLTARYGMVHVAPGVIATAGTYSAGLAFLARDTVQDTAGRWGVTAAIAIGAVISWVMSTPVLAIASTAAFLISEFADMAVYTPLRTRGWVRAVAASNAVGAVLDTVVFLLLAGFPVLASLPGQLVGKAWATAVPLALVWGVSRAVPRDPQYTGGA